MCMQLSFSNKSGTDRLYIWTDAAETGAMCSNLLTYYALIASIIRPESKMTVPVEV